MTRSILTVLFLTLFSLCSSAALAGKSSGPMTLGKGVNLAHWLSQTQRTGEARTHFLGESDLQRIATLGFDHVRLPIDEKQMWDEQGERDEQAFAIMHNAIRWSLAYGLAVVIDLHILRSHHFNAEEKSLWTDPADQKHFIGLWRDLSSALKDYPVSAVAYELMNEPVADDPEDWNRLLARAFAEVRRLEPDRTIIIGSNRWQSADTFDELVVPDDPNIILSFHFYEPFMLSHYATPWTFLRDYSGPVHYPGVILSEAEFSALPAKQTEAVKDYVGRSFDRDILLEMMAKPLAKARALGLPLYCGEYGVFHAAPADDRRRWFEDMMSLFEQTGVSSALWNYKSDEFGMVGLDGQPIEAVESVITAQ